jgi:hypothetical protein
MSMFSLPRLWLEMSGQLHELAVLPAAPTPSFTSASATNQIRSWMGPRNGLDDVEK